jgi:hypothetical protein
MLNYNHSAYTGAQLGAAALAAGFSGVQIYVSPYCNNANCKRTTGKYAVGIKAIITAFRAAAPGLEIALLANEWDNVQIFAAAGLRTDFDSSSFVSGLPSVTELPAGSADA